MLQASEVRVGVVAYFEQQQLHLQPDMVVPKVSGNIWKLRPFVCTWAAGGRSRWTGLTTTESAVASVRLAPDQVVNAYGPIGSNECFVHGSVYEGPNDAFVRASAIERPFFRGMRPFLNRAGMRTVYEAIKRREAADADLCESPTPTEDVK